MIAVGIEASWTFVQSPTYTTLSITVGLIAGIFLAALMIQQELLQEVGAANPLPRRARPARGAPILCVDDRPRHPHGKVAVVPLIICFAVIVILRLATLAYQRPDTTSSSTKAPTAQQTTVVNVPATH